MSYATNPYQAPNDTEPSDQPASAAKHRSWWTPVFWTAAGFTGFGFVALFLRNAPPIGFLLIAFVLFLVLLIASRQYRKRSALGILLTLLVMAGAFIHLRQMQTQAVREQAMRARMAAEQALERARALEEAPQDSQSQAGRMTRKGGA